MINRSFGLPNPGHVSATYAERSGEDRFRCHAARFALERDGIGGLPVALADAARTEQLTAPPPDVITDRAAWVYAAISDYYARR